MTNTQRPPLAGRVAVVTGASWGIGTGAAVELGAAGVTVYVSGRSTREGPHPGTVAATAAEVSELGDEGEAVVCDHRDDKSVSCHLVEQRRERRVQLPRGRSLARQAI